jgi:hypothetical protein
MGFGYILVIALYIGLSKWWVDGKMGEQLILYAKVSKCQQHTSDKCRLMQELNFQVKPCGDWYRRHCCKSALKVSKNVYGSATKTAL